MRLHLTRAVIACACLCGLQTGARASGTCTFAGSIATLYVNLNGGPTVLSVDSAGTILLDSVPCGIATTANTDLINVTGNYSVADTLTLDKPGRFAPGLTPEATGKSEVEVNITLDGDAKDKLVVRLTGAAETFEIDEVGYNTDAINTRGDSDFDITVHHTDNATYKILGLGGDDTISVYSGVLTDVYGGAGNDIINGNYWGHVLSGGSGNDEIYGGDTSNTLDGGPGDDFLVGAGGRDTLIGGDGADILDAGPGKDKLYGDDGNDTLDGGSELDVFDGGYGDDVIHNADGIAETVDCSDGIDDAEPDPVDTFIACEL